MSVSAMKLGDVDLADVKLRHGLAGENPSGPGLAGCKLVGTAFLDRFRPFLKSIKITQLLDFMQL